VRYGSVCSGVEAATVAWHPLGWKPQWFSEIEKFPSDVLQHHYPDVPNLGDMTKFKEWPHDQSIELLVGGTPCQSFSVAGLRKGLSDPRGNLMLTYLAIAARYSPRWLVWENVPGVLSSNQGRDFGTFLWALGELGYGFAYRTLDAQYFGVAQRRRRVFVVGYLGDWRRAAAVLFERESLQGHPPPSRETGKEVAGTVTRGAFFSRTGNERVECEPIVPMQVFDKQRIGQYGSGEVSSTVAARDYKDATDLIVAKATSETKLSDVTMSITASYRQGGVDLASKPMAMENKKVRRLTPKETERLQGFPDDYTQISYRNKDASDCPDGQRYKAMGNSMAVPVMRWIGQRINMVHNLQVPDTTETT